ncbi:hypothetical protein N7462_010856 [Penicillium macrosclerotiorum]|uniref:uncharacterized protein n=1 Tax=Penicillium macrosclerotiorum TaxID=303699 RepID=UPI0025467F36|nr:uncharacterized protein N7462_010856 [Penicillium macrosclerotiorum]KAJ5669786.1 hypothetical protein N7462_010856 [Penicillium macrosclerotiorum]
MPKETRNGVQRSRTPKACDRCRRQKLKCDEARPCVLCLRAGNECETSLRTPGRRKRPQSTVATISTKPAVNTPQSQASGNTISGPVGQGPLTPIATPYSESSEIRTNTSTIDFARSVFNEGETGRTFTGASIPGDMGKSPSNESIWTLKGIQMPPTPVMRALIDAYFHRMQWFILIFHEPSFRATAEKILSQSHWERKHLGSVMALLGVTSIALQSVIPDPSWEGCELLVEHEIDPSALLQGFIAEIRLHLIDLLDDCQIECVQVCSLLSSYYVYHNSPSLAWNLSGMAVRAAYALNIQSKEHTSKDPVENEIHSRCWNHMLVGDTFCSVIYGRPPSINTSSAGVRSLTLSEDLNIDPWLLGNPILTIQDWTTSSVPFHMMKGELYGISRRNLSRLRHLHSTAENIEDKLRVICEITQETDRLLSQWRSKVPELFDMEYWKSEMRWEKISQELSTLPLRTKRNVETVYFQAAVLQLTYDAAIIQTHRPLLEQEIYNSSRQTPFVETLRQSLEAATTAALRISRAPINDLRTQYVSSFASLQQFTAGVILCIPPTSQPFTPASLEAKEGVIRIIHASRSQRCYNRIARHTEQLLTELLRVTTQREMARALGDSTTIGSITQPCSLSTDGQSRFGTNVQHSSASIATSSAMVAPGEGNPQSQSSSEHFQRTWTSDQDLFAAAMAPSDFPSAHIFQQLDDTFGSFGESGISFSFLSCCSVLSSLTAILVLFNLVPDDHSSSWNWGRTLP